MEQRLKFRLVFGEEEYKQEKSAAEQSPDVELGDPEPIKTPEGKGLTTAHFVDPVSVIASATVAWVVKRLLDHWLKEQEQGVQIDLTKDPPDISRIAGAPRGFIVIIRADRTPETHFVEGKSAEDIGTIIRSLAPQES